MNDHLWVLLDTETTGLAGPIEASELAAHGMGKGCGSDCFFVSTLVGMNGARIKYASTGSK